MSMSNTSATDQDPALSPPATGTVLVWLALILSLTALAGSLWLSLGLGLKACPLCFYQRSFMMALVAILGLGLLTSAARPARPSLLAVPLAVAGLGVAVFHVSLEARGILECPGGLLDLGTAPQQSLAVFAVLTILLVLDATASRAWSVLVGGACLGGVLALASCVANPPLPPAPAAPYDPLQRIDVCRPPYQAASVQP